MTTWLVKYSWWFQETSLNTKKYEALSKVSATLVLTVLVAGNETQKLRGDILFATKSIPKPKEVMQPEVIKKIELSYRKESIDYAVFGQFHLFCFCYAVRNSNLKVEYVSWSGMNTWTGYFEMQKTSLNTKKHTWDFFRKTKGLCFETRIGKVVSKGNVND